MPKTSIDRRSFLQVASLAPALFTTTSATGQEERSAIERLQVGVIGTGWRPDIKRHGRGIAIGRQAAKLSDVVAICDVDSVAGEYAMDKVAQGQATFYHDYQELLLRDDIDAVLIATPDHWHAKMSIDAMRAGKDVYCEKPATVTINEGRWMVDAAKATQKILQVGTQQRTEIQGRFAKAIALVRSGRLGTIRTIRIGVDEGLSGGPFQKTPPPDRLDWNRWQGPAAAADYIAERTHWTFRWWLEYAGGKLTDWGAHHVDIAQWAIEKLDSGPTLVAGQGEFLQPFVDGQPTRDDIYSTPTTFEVTCRFDDVPTHGSVEMVIHSGENGILFIGDKGRIFVNRGKLTGKPVEDLETNPLPEDSVASLYHELPFAGDRPQSHMHHFIDCVKNRRTPISDMESHQRTITTCHLANLALRLGRELKWDSKNERIIGDDQANEFLERPYREGFQVETA